MKIIKSLLTLKQKQYLKYLLSKNSNIYNNIDKNKKKIIVALAADYGNLGDVAITYAQTKFLKDKFPEYEVIDFPISKTFTDMKALKKICNDDDIITIVGGGNTTDIYEDIEYCRQFIIKQFPKNKIISFPQTVDFSNTTKGRRLKEKSVNIYGNHKKLILSAREEKSFHEYKKNFSNDVKYIPDIVLYLDEQSPNSERDGVILCLRNDKEKVFEKAQQDTLIERLSQNFKILYNDTHIDKSNMSIEERKFELNKIWNNFKKSKVVLTDRLHGMIFCAITNTPCVAIDNSNRKISGVYNAWLKDINYIKLIEGYNIEKIYKAVEDLYDINIEDSTQLNLEAKYYNLIQEIKVN